jgi:hypothetical protein
MDGLRCAKCHFELSALKGPLGFFFRRFGAKFAPANYVFEYDATQRGIGEQITRDRSRRMG